MKKERPHIVNYNRLTAGFVYAEVHVFKVAYLYWGSASGVATHGSTRAQAQVVACQCQGDQVSGHSS